LLTILSNGIQLFPLLCAMIVCQDGKPNARISQIETILVFISISFSVRSGVASQKGGVFRTHSDRTFHGRFHRGVTGQDPTYKSPPAEPGHIGFINRNLFPGTGESDVSLRVRSSRWRSGLRLHRSPGQCLPR
jgi:hypothetical protein